MTTQDKAEPVFKYFDGTVVVPFRVEVQPNKFLTGTVRPPTPKELTAFLRELGKAGADADQVRAAFYVKHVKSWNVDGPLSPDAMSNLPPVLFNAMDGIVCDQRGCDLLLGKSDA